MPILQYQNHKNRRHYIKNLVRGGQKEKKEKEREKRKKREKKRKKKEWGQQREKANQYDERAPFRGGFGGEC